MNNEVLNSEQNTSKNHKKFRVTDFIAYFICLAISFGIWVYVVSTETENYEYTFENVAVQFEGVNELENERDLSILSGYDTTINITVIGSRKNILKYTAEDIYVYVNLDGITKADRYALDVVVELPDNMKLSSSNPTKINVFVDENDSVTFDIEVAPLYSLPAGYTLHEAEPSVETITVTGPKTILDEIAAAKVTYDIGTVTNSVTFISPIDLVDKEGNKVVNPYIKTDVSEVVVTIPVTMKKILPLVAEYTANDTNTFSYEITFEPEMIEIEGDPLIVSALNDIKVNVKDVTNSKGGTTNKLVLPENVKLSDESQSTVKFVVNKTAIETIIE